MAFPRGDRIGELNQSIRATLTLPPTPHRPVHYSLACLAVLLVVAVLASGCATTKEGQPPATPRDSAATVGAIAESVTYSAVAWDLADNPQRRTNYAHAAQMLKALLLLPEISPAGLHQVLSTLPIRELRSDKARILIGNAEIVYQTVLRQQTPITLPAYVRTVAERTLAGLDRALEGQP